jgi:hypothetical protein
VSTVITEQQARQITGGRKPLVPVEYEAALKSLSECMSIDDAKYWADKSDALAAWAKIYHDDQAAIDARRLKLHAFHRMGTLARELYPNERGGGQKGMRGGRPGPQAELRKRGLAPLAATNAVRISRATEQELAKHLAAGHGVQRTAIEFRGRGPQKHHAVSSEAWLWLTNMHVQYPSPHIKRVAAAFRSRDPKDVAAGLSDGEVAQARQLATELIEWLDEFDQYLPKAPPSE